MKKNKQNTPKVCTILLADRELQYTLKRSSRRTVGIAIEKNGLVKVACPNYTSESYINQLLLNKMQWILEKLANIEAKESKTKKAKVFEDGEYFSYLGKEYKLKLVGSIDLKRPTVWLEDENFVITLPINFEKEKIRNSLKLWYVERFKLLIEERINNYSKIIGVYPQRITIREQKTRWGSCSAKGNLNFNWKLIMASLEVLDYVVIHELCHMKEMNHSKEFWKLVEYIFPQYKKCRAWLKENGDLLSLE
ncbi:MAG TPA: SprT family zinc-dependent metalloprotease [Ruminiclostridium sp.]